VAVAIVLLACACTQPVPRDATGEEIYAELCARCHGADLEGGIGAALGAGSSSAAEDDEYLEFTIRNGRGRMPSFPSLEDDQVRRLVDFLREAQKS
jgi:mono/diheme cytochrome c family protein